METKSEIITVAHVRSPSGDHYLEVFEGKLTDRQIAQMVYEGAPDWWGDSETVEIENSEVIIFTS
jgi:hypothetical protein